MKQVQLSMVFHSLIEIKYKNVTINKKTISIVKGGGDYSEAPLP